MALAEKRVFIRCRNCGRETVFHKKHREALAVRLGKGPLELTGQDVQKASETFKCKECGRKGVEVREVDRPVPRTLYVAGGRSEAVIPIFHKDSCGWVGHVHKADIIEFESREAAVMSGYRPCRVCRP